VAHRSSAAELLSVLPADAEPLSWAPFAVRANCRACGTPAEPADPVTDRVVACPSCGSAVRLRTTQRIRRAEAGRTLRELGLAAEDIVAARLPGGGFSWYRLGR
jgi:hypothetical protein